MKRKFTAVALLLTFTTAIGLVAQETAKEGETAKQDEKKAVATERPSLKEEAKTDESAKTAEPATTDESSKATDESAKTPEQDASKSAVAPQPESAAPAPKLDENRPRIGATFGDTAGGAYIVSVFTNSPAHKQGLQSGDIVTGVDGNKIETAMQLATALSAKKEGEAVAITFKRGNEEMEITPKLISRMELAKVSNVDGSSATSERVEVARVNYDMELDQLEQRLKTLTAEAISTKEKIADLTQKKQESEAAAKAAEEKAAADKAAAEKAAAEKTEGKSPKEEPKAEEAKEAASKEATATEPKE